MKRSFVHNELYDPNLIRIICSFRARAPRHRRHMGKKKRVSWHNLSLRDENINANANANAIAQDDVNFNIEGEEEEEEIEGF